MKILEKYNKENKVVGNCPFYDKCPSCGEELYQVSFKEEGDEENVWWCRECDVSIDSDGGIIE